MKKYKITVLSNLDGNAQATLKSAIGLAKIIGGEIEVFNVKKASEIVDSDNQLSAMRSINHKHIALRKKMQRLIDPISEQFNVKINSSFSIGNIKGEIGQYIENNKPDIIVLGKRKEKALNLAGDRIATYLLNKFKGVIMVANDKNVLDSNKKISLGTLNNFESQFNLDFAEDLIEHTEKPLKSFKIGQSSTAVELPKAPAETKTIEYVFEQSDGVMNGISNYLVKHKIDILYVDRFKKNQEGKRNTLRSDIINKLNVTLLVPGEENYNN